MLSRKSFLRKIPYTVDKTQTIHIESLVFAVDSINICASRMLDVANKFSTEITGSDTQIKRQLISDAWSIIDLTHAARKSIDKLSLRKSCPKADDYFIKFEQATLLRNDMDHIHEKAGNLSNKNHRLPIFGVLSYIYKYHSPQHQDEGFITEGASIAICAGRIENETHIPILNPDNFTLKFGPSAFHLTAFDKSINIDEIVEKSNSMIIEVNDKIEEVIIKQLQTQADKNGDKIEQYLSHGGGDTAFSMFFGYKT